MMDTERLKKTKEMEQLEILLSNGYGMQTDKRNLWNERRINSTFHSHNVNVLYESNIIKLLNDSKYIIYLYLNI